jgi:hypothetical protein
MGLEDLTVTSNGFPGTIAFDTTYAYQISTNSPYTSHDVSFYKNSASAAATGYVAKAAATPVNWNGQDYQQFWTVNYENAFWACNGVPVPFNTTNIGMQFAPANTITYVSNTATSITLTITNCPLIIGDLVFLNEWTSSSAANSLTLNQLSGFVSACNPNTTPLATKTLTITFPNAAIATDTFVPGIVQYLTNSSDSTKDCIRWYDGDPTTTSNGWVNFCPPLSRLSFSIAEQIAAQYYLVGAKLMVPFKDRLLFLGAVIQSSTGSPIYLHDTIVYSQNGTPYYNATFSADPTLSTTVFNTILAPGNQTATVSSWWEDQTGFGGYISAGVDQPINTCSPNEDVLITGFDNLKMKVAYTSNDLIPFNFFIINSEYGDASTFSTITTDDGVFSRGTRAYTITNQNSSQRIDLEIPDQVFEINLTQNGNERFCAQRDFIKELIFFTYPSNQSQYKFPNQTLLLNYRDKSYSILYETYTTYGQFKPLTGDTWATIGNRYPTWSVWNTPWDSGDTTLLQPLVIAGNQQGFVMVRTDGTDEGQSLMIQNISGSTVTAPNHQLNVGDYIQISGCNGTIGSLVNGKIFSVANPQTNSFTLNSPLTGSGTYQGGGLIKRFSVPFIQSKQFPMDWQNGRKTRIGVQRHLFTTTANAQVQLLIYLSQDAENALNDTGVPTNSQLVSALIYSTVMYTCPESTNLGLTPANVNLNQLTTFSQSQTWHRLNTSLLGDTVQFAITLSDQQMRTVDQSGNLISQEAEIEYHGSVIDVSSSQMLV